MQGNEPGNKNFSMVILSPPPPDQKVGGKWWWNLTIEHVQIHAFKIDFGENVKYYE